MEQKLWLTLSKTREQGQFIEPTVYRVYSHRNNHRRMDFTPRVWYLA